jgi:hypothetical protein
MTLVCWLKLWKIGSSKRSGLDSARRQAGRLLSVERLEDRTVPSARGASAAFLAQPQGPQAVDLAGRTDGGNQQGLQFSQDHGSASPQATTSGTRGGYPLPSPVGPAPRGDLAAPKGVTAALPPLPDRTVFINWSTLTLGPTWSTDAARTLDEGPQANPVPGSLASRVPFGSPLSGGIRAQEGVTPAGPQQNKTLETAVENRPTAAQGAARAGKNSADRQPTRESFWTAGNPRDNAAATGNAALQEKGLFAFLETEDVCQFLEPPTFLAVRESATDPRAVPAAGQEPNYLVAGLMITLGCWWTDRANQPLERKVNRTRSPRLQPTDR